MPTVEQIRAARALIGWSQGDLADHAGLSQTGIARIENGTNHPNSTTIEKIRSAFERVNVEFLDDSGVRKRSGQVQMLRGAQGIRQFFNELYDCAKTGGGEICLFNGVPSKLDEWLGVEWYAMHKERMLKIKDNFEYKIIVREGETNLPASDYATYRFFPEKLFNEKTIYVFGGSVYFRDADNKELRIIKIQQEDLCNSMKVLFNVSWDYVASKAA